MFHIIDAEIKWRKTEGRPAGFSSLLASKPVVAIGADHPLEEEVLAADHFRELQAPIASFSTFQAMLTA